MNYTGTSGNNTITGTNSADTFDMSQGGDDTVNGGAGDDVFNYGAAFNELDTVNGGSGSDTLNLDGNYASGFFIANGTIASIETIHLAAGNDYSFTTDTTLIAANTDMKVDGSDLGAANTLDFDGSAETSGHFTLEGGLGNDTLKGGSGNDVFYDRNGGNDTASGGGGNDTFNFGPALTGSDTISGGTGSNTVNITGDYTGSNALVMKTTTFDSIGKFHLGAAFDYHITTIDNASDQTLTVDASDLASPNTLTLDATHNTGTILNILGGAGDDTVHFAANFASGDIDGGAGNDTLTLNGDYSDVHAIGPGTLLNVETVKLSAGNSYNFDFEDGNLASGQTITFDGSALGASNALAFDGIFATEGSFKLVGGAGDDILAGSTRADTIQGGAGDDQIQPDGGADSVNMGDGNDFAFYFDNSFIAAASINGGDGTDELVLQGDYSHMVAFTGTTIRSVETIDVQGDFSFNLKLADANIAAGAAFQIDAFYTSAADSLNFNDGAETNAALTVVGGMGDDTITAGGGTHNIRGNDGNDTFNMLGNLKPADLIDGGTGNDTVTLNGDYSAGLTFGGSTMVSVETLRLAGGHSYKLTTIDATVASGQSLTVDGHALGAGDSLTFNGAAETDGTFALTGGAGADTLTAGSGNDTLDGGGGADRMRGGAGSDIFVYGAAGDSTSTGYDTIIGFSAARGTFNLGPTVTGVDATIASGALSTASFDSDLAAAADATHLLAHHAVLFTPGSGTLSGQTFLVVDLNGTAGYQAGADLVIDLQQGSALSSLSTANFI